MNGVHFNYTNAAPHGAHYRKERGREIKNRDWKIGVAEERDEKKKTAKLEMKGGAGRNMWECKLNNLKR